MRIYIALLRGINVSGKKIVTMPELKQVFTAAGYSSVTTYINSGNVIFKSGKSDPDGIRQILEKRIEARFGFEVKVIVIGLDELNRYLSECPFKEDALGAGEKIYLTLLSKLPSKQEVGAIEIKKGDIDEHVLRGKVVYLLVKNGYSNTSLNNTFLENVNDSHQWPDAVNCISALWALIYERSLRRSNGIVNCSGADKLPYRIDPDKYYRYADY